MRYLSVKFWSLIYVHLCYKNTITLYSGSCTSVETFSFEELLLGKKTSRLVIILQNKKKNKEKSLSFRLLTWRLKLFYIYLFKTRS